MEELLNSDFIALIMAGGSGTRFWPMSQPEMPKQYLTLFGDRSLIQSTVDRLKKKARLENIFICSGQSQKEILNQQLPEITGLILEPSGRNTAPCLMLSMATLLNRGIDPTTVVGIFPADHVIGNEPAFLNVLKFAIEEAKSSNSLITLGIQPNSPHTGYGYIEAGKKLSAHAFTVNRFIEKPRLETAQEYLSKGTVYWNAGIFFWRLDTITRAFETCLPEEWKKVQLAVNNNSVSDVYPSLTSQPIDTAILEKATNVRVIPVEMNWSDIGSWSALLDYHQQLTHKDNIVISRNPNQCTLLDSHNCLVAHDKSQRVVLIGVNDLIVIETQQGLLITHRTQDQRVKEIK